MDVVIDVQGYKGYKGLFIVKEIAILGVRHDLEGHWILQPTRSLKFPDKYRREYNWLTTHHHRIKWHSGNTTFRNLMQHIRQLLVDVDYIYVRGACKAAFMERYTNKEVINVETEEDCPSFMKMPPPLSVCSYHTEMGPSTKKQHVYCALAQAHQLRTWLKENSSVEQFFNE